MTVSKEIKICAGIVGVIGIALMVMLVFWSKKDPKRDARLPKLDTNVTSGMDPYSDADISVKDECERILRAQHAAVMSKDLKYAMNLIHSDSPIRAEGRVNMANAIAFGPPTICILSCTLESTEDGQVVLQANQMYKWGGRKSDVLCIERHTFQKENGAWKLWLSHCDQKVEI